MPAIDFPTDPSLNQEFTSGNRTWIWNGVAWEAYGTYIGATGPTGPTGSAGNITATVPVAYNSSTEVISLNYGLGLTTSGDNLAVLVSDPLKIDGANAVTVNVGGGLVTTANALTVNVGSGLAIDGGAVIANTSVVTTLTGTQTLTNKTLTAPRFTAPRETVVVNAASALSTGTSINALAGAVTIYTTTPSANAAVTLSLGVSGGAGSMANTLPNTGDSITVGVVNPSGASFATFINVIQIDGSVTNVTTQWQLGAVPTQATTSLSSSDSYLFTIVNTNTATSPKTYRVYASRTRYA